MCSKYTVRAFGVEHLHVGYFFNFQPKRFVGPVLKGALDPQTVFAVIKKLANSSMEPALPLFEEILIN